MSRGKFTTPSQQSGVNIVEPTNRDVSFISDGDFKTADSTEEMLFTKSGKETTASEIPKKEKIFAKILVKNERSSYYVRVADNILYDPLSTHTRSNDYRDSQMKRVSKGIFDSYILYLTTNNSLYMTRAQRGYINE